MAAFSTIVCLALCGFISVQGLLTTCSKPGYSDGNYEHPDDCRRFLQCNKGETIELDCPDNKVYNEKKRLCDDLANVPRCQPTTPQPATAVPPVDLKNYCYQNALIDGSYPHPSDCQKYIQCNSQATTIVVCPSGKVYNEMRRLCDKPEDVPRCNGQTSQDPSTGQPQTTDPSGVSGTCNAKSLPDGSYIHPIRCDQYIQCANFFTTIITCQTGLVYNENIKKCDLVVNVPRCQDGSTTATATTDYLNGSGTGTTVVDFTGYNTYCSDNALSTGIHPDPYSCYHFVECTFGRTDHMACPGDLAFDVSLMTCTDRQQVDCSQRLSG